MKIEISNSFCLDNFVEEDALPLVQFIAINKQRLVRYFPVTTSDNSNIQKTNLYIALKAKEASEKKTFTFAIKEVNTHKIAGLILIKKINWTDRIGELAYCIGNEFEGKGIITKAVKAITDFAYDVLDLKTLQIIAHKTNLGSVKVAENNGFVWKKTLANEFTPTNEPPLDMELYEHTHEK